MDVKGCPSNPSLMQVKMAETPAIFKTGTKIELEVAINWIWNPQHCSRGPNATNSSFGTFQCTFSFLKVIFIKEITPNVLCSSYKRIWVLFSWNLSCSQRLLSEGSWDSAMLCPCISTNAYFQGMEQENMLLSVPIKLKWNEDSSWKLMHFQAVKVHQWTNNIMRVRV